MYRTIGTTKRPLIERLVSMFLGKFIVQRSYEVVNMKSHICEVLR